MPLAVSGATSRNWRAGVTGDWFAAGNWVENAYPTAGDDAIVTNAGAFVWLTNATEFLNSITLSRTLMFSNWNAALRATNVWINSGGLISHVTNNATTTNEAGGWTANARVWIVCSNLFVAGGAAINADGKGFSGGGYYTYGRGPGGGSSGGGGGSYGGEGGFGGVWDIQPNRAVYGSAAMPDQPGSGGGGVNTPYGQAGGGTIRIAADNLVTVNGTISANGQNADGGGGSGGAVYITCPRMDGTNGLLSAIGGNSRVAGGGGGGRISVMYDPSVQAAYPLPAARFSTAAGGSDNPDSSGAFGRDPFDNIRYGRMGTLYFPDNRFLTETITHSGWWHAPGFTNWAPSSLTISNGWIGFPSNNFTLTVANDLRIWGTNAYLNKLEMKTNAVLTCQGNIEINKASLTLWSAAAEGNPGPVVAVGGSLKLTNGALFQMHSAATNASGPEYGALVTVAGDTYIAANSWIYPVSHAINGGSAQFMMANLTIMANGGFNANSAGFKEGSGPGRGRSDTQGLGGGGGYGGRAGGYAANYGQTYGSSNAPVLPGSSGGYYGGRGGGLARLSVARTFTMNGTIQANGSDGTRDGGGAINQDGSGGSGGGIYITCGTFAGNGGTFRANGGIGGTRYGRGGGGGRIAVWRIRDVSAGAGSNSVSGGAGGLGGALPTNSEPGTVVWGWLPTPGTVLTIH